MFTGLLKKIFGSRNERLLKQYRRTVRAVNALEPQIEKLTDTELRAKTDEFRNRIRDRLAKIPDDASDDPQRAAGLVAERDRARREMLDQLLPEAFAVVREASKRTLNMRHFDVQLIGGFTLHSGKIAEMRTGEGKTLVATLPAYLNALAGQGVHIVTVNDYLAQRDADWMGKIYRFLGLTVGVNLSQMEHELKQAAYAADITYGTNNEFGFDYLRDNMVYQVSEKVQRGLGYAIVDEVDSILIDEARTPLIISGQAEDTTDLYGAIDNVAPKLVRQKEEKGPGDYWVDEKAHQVLLSEQGHEHAEELLAQAGLLAEGSSLYDPSNIILVHHLYAALRAHSLFLRDQQYVVQNDEIIIVDEFTGRLMPGRRWSEGLHQAVEAKEGVEIQKENQTLATITFQNYFRMYRKLAGMTGTADTEAYEFQQIYGLETVVIPTHHPMIRDDRGDQVYRTAREKHQAIINDIRDCHERGQPALVGTTSIENSEVLSAMLEKEKLPHNVLNAKQHAREAEIVIQAGRPKMITIATNMAGRGTDIVLGGNPNPEINQVRADESLEEPARSKRADEILFEWQKLHNQVVAAGGLHIVGTERHESRRIDNQLRGRSGRQGDPGSSRFYLSLEDPLLRIFASDRVAAIMDRLKMPEGEAIEHPWVTRSIENAQRKVEARNFDIRKHLLEYDDVANDQRKVIYQQRNELLETSDITETLDAMRADVVSTYINQHIPPESLEEQWDAAGLEKTLESELQLRLPIRQWLKEESELDETDLRNRIIEVARQHYRDKIAGVDREAMRHYERAIMLQSLDSHWREHLAALDHLRQGIHLRGYAQKNPTQEYKREAFELFSLMLEMIKTEVTKILMTVQIRSAEELQAVEEPEMPTNVQYQHAEFAGGGDTAVEAEADTDVAVAEKPQPYVRGGQKVGRNDPCPCGSGKKYKHCHGKLT
ncbi:MAG: preprotein translocase subunit SecA [Betaproteobacteria bacterium RIFCSPLOWO2_12_FULL_62_58]|nr:MAG: preprotein translocase subunit SecA [Betaproteobacteria bacterium RIFCSPLOWO2_02_FULL_62_79]OGA49066.1 MAG: preprotein translocase subunit SecA [Betaproteobacteria bacterium RIFCSPLOWO2_12_FULL_62_58]